MRLYTRPDCSLCEELRDELEAAFAGRFQLETRWVDEQREWKKRYGLRIPVLCGDQDELLCEGRFDAAAVAAHLGTAAR